MSELNAAIGRALVERLGEKAPRPEIRWVVGDGVAHIFSSGLKRDCDELLDGMRRDWPDIAIHRSVYKLEHWYFSTDGNAMLALLDAMRELGFTVDIDNIGDQWSIAVLYGIEQVAWECGATLPDAAAKAAAAALGVEVKA